MLLPIAAHWRNIGVLLGIENNLLGTIKRNEEQVEDCLREMLLEWLKNVHLQRTWCSLANAVEPFDQQKAQEIRDSVA